METLREFLSLPQAEELANLQTEKTHLKPLHFAVEAGAKEAVKALVALTEEYKGQDAEAVFSKVRKQLDAAKEETAPPAKPTVELTTGQRKICEKKRDLGKAAFSKKQYADAIRLFSEAMEINPYDERSEQRAEAPPTWRRRSSRTRCGTRRRQWS